MSIERSHNLRLTLSDDEHRMANELAEAEGTSVSGILRRFIRKAHAKKLGGMRQSKTTAKR